MKPPIITLNTKPDEDKTLLAKLFKNAGIGAPQNEKKQHWEDLNEIYQVIATGIIDTSVQVNEAIRELNAIGVTSSSEVGISVRGLIADITKFTSDLKAVAGRHEGKTGPITDGEELSVCLSIFNEYTALYDSFRAVSFPVVLMMTEYLSEAHNAKKELDAVDPTVVTDVPVKETTQ